MEVTAKDLRFKINMLFDVLNKGEDITITYRGKAKAKLISTQKYWKKDDSLFGIWKDKEDNVDDIVRNMRKGRDFDIWQTFRYRCFYLVSKGKSKSLWIDS